MLSLCNSEKNYERLSFRGYTLYKNKPLLAPIVIMVKTLDL